MVLLLVGCADPLEQELDRMFECTSLTSDCCSTDDGCALFTDGVAPYCLRSSGPDGGICAECVSDSDCRGQQQCIDIVPVDGPQWETKVCLNPSECYEGYPFTFTPCG